MDLIGQLVSGLYALVILLLGVYGFQALLFTGLYLWHRCEVSPRGEGPLPTVTVQLPLYNEMWVARRAIQAAAQLDYPRSKLQIQVLDDSTDATRDIVDQTVAPLLAAGHRIEVLRREVRTGFKAGALAEAMPGATGEVIALFDADFVPPREWLRQVVPYFLASPEVGLVQTRWGHLNSGYSMVTQAQALALDAHFVVEQTARQRSGLLCNFNGSGGAWRRKCIDSAGGWSARTLCEDLDLSYRAQLAGWKVLYLPKVVVPGELPPTVSAFKLQQRRWATGSIQCLRYLAGPLLRSGMSAGKVLAGLVHLGGYLGHPLLLMLLALTLPQILINGPDQMHLAFLAPASLGLPLLHVTSQWGVGELRPRTLPQLLMLYLLGAGIAVSNSAAVLRALGPTVGEFVRTPKFSIVGGKGRWAGRGYSPSDEPWPVGELVAAAYAGTCAVAAVTNGLPGLAPLMVLYGAGFLYVAWSTWREGRAHRAAPLPAGTAPDLGLPLGR